MLHPTSKQSNHVTPFIQAENSQKTLPCLKRVQLMYLGKRDSTFTRLFTKQKRQQARSTPEKVEHVAV